MKNSAGLALWVWLWAFAWAAAWPAEKPLPALFLPPAAEWQPLEQWGSPNGSWSAADGVWVSKGAGETWVSERFGDFVLDLEFKLPVGVEGGLFLRAAKREDAAQTCLKVQWASGNTEEKPGLTSCGALQDCMAPAKALGQPAGEWNRMVVTCQGDYVQLLLNGRESCAMHLSQWTEAGRNPDGSPNPIRQALRDLPREGELGLTASAAGVQVRHVRVKRWPVAPPPVAQRLDPFMGEYVGTFTPVGGAPEPAEAQVFPIKGGTYSIVLACPSVRESRKGRRVELTAPWKKLEKGQPPPTQLDLAGKLPEWKGLIANDELSASGAGPQGGEFRLRYVWRTSPTEGLAAPPQAVVLLPWAKAPPSLAAWTNQEWRPLPDGSMQVTKGNSLTQHAFKDFLLHLEFLNTYEPQNAGQGRSNSGVKLMTRYEIQILDSFGLPGQKDDCGAIYTQKEERVNATLPPGLWQTYDVVFRTARFGADGKQVEKLPRVTVLHNGVQVHEEHEIPAGTGASPKTHEKEGPILLQDHNHAVRFRNIWLVELP